jgi:hypothetical protein
MSFGKAIQHENATALMEFAAAQQRYKQASSIFTRVRFELAGSGESDEAVIRFYKARKLYSEQCKAYQTARAIYINAVRFAAAKLPQITDRELLSITVETNDKAIHEAIRTEAITSSISQEDFEMARRVMKERAEAKTAQEKLNSGNFTEAESEFDNGFDKL